MTKFISTKPRRIRVRTPTKWDTAGLTKKNTKAFSKWIQEMISKPSNMKSIVMLTGDRSLRRRTGIKRQRGLTRRTNRETFCPMSWVKCSFSLKVWVNPSIFWKIFCSDMDISAVRPQWENITFTRTWWSLEWADLWPLTIWRCCSIF